MTHEELETEVKALREFTLKHVGSLRARVFPDSDAEPLADGLGAMRSIYSRGTQPSTVPTAGTEKLEKPAAGMAAIYGRKP